MTQEPVGAIVAVASESLESIVKEIERSKNIKGEIVHGLWQGVTKATAAFAVFGDRAQIREEGYGEGLGAP
ncbi:hypothetical protein ALC62_05722 [Cyphomyrmex costatus]|uniref:Uncharacterized protein n=1 Tax=Cyphomyrmex costatus TaxID=456900 RepID=A0A151IJH7_9HYME|nr:hypothetical protein ALC62_05722 [Cyphomyrmex costatus]